MTPDPDFWPDAALVALLLLAWAAGKAIDRRLIGHRPAQQPGDVAGLARGLAAIGCSTAAGLFLICGVGALMLWYWSGH